MIRWLLTACLLAGSAFADVSSERLALFNGKNLDGWYTFLKERGRDSDPKGVFTVKDGILRISGEEWGCITSFEAYADYRLVVEFKWGEATHAPREDRARDSGVLLHSTGADGAYGGLWMHAIECQMIEGGTGDLLVVGDNTDRFAISCPVAPAMQGSSHVFQADGAVVTINGGRINWYGRDPDWQDVKGFRGGQDVEKPVGEWNRLECIADGGAISVRLNGTVVNRAIEARPRRGRIQIQSEGAEVFVRRVDLMPLTSAGENGPPAPAIQPALILAVANKHDDTLCFIDPMTVEVLETIRTGPNPHEMVITPDRRILYLSNYAPPGNTISVIDLVHRKHIKQISTGEYTRIHGAAMAPDGKHAYFTAGQTGFVVEVDTQTHEMTRAMPTHGLISHMVLVSPDGKRLYTANIESQNVSVIDRASGELLTQVPCGQGVEGMSFTPDGKFLWAANQTGGSITIIDVATHAPIETFACPGMPVRIRFTADGKRALVPSWTEEGQLIVIDTATKQEIKRIRVGSFAIGVEITPDGRRAFVGCEKTDGLHVIDMATLRVERVMQTGNGPDPMSIYFSRKES